MQTVVSLYALSESGGSMTKRSSASLLLYLLCETMNSTAARTCASLSEALPALGGIAPLPFSTDCTSESAPVLMRGAQAALSPSFGDPATDCAWQATQVWS